MEYEINLRGRKIKYNLQYKKVKNINLRIKPDGTVFVSANRRVSKKFIEEFMIFKADFILNALENFNNKVEVLKKQYFTREEIKDVILEFCQKAYPYFQNKGIAYPEIKFRTMISRWGSCHTVKGILTFNINLMYAPPECVEYVVLHEFTHFLVANHSERFYEELSKVCPCWKEYRNKLKEIQLR